MAVYGINFDEVGSQQPLNYQSVHISYGKLDEEKVFDSGNFVKDWFDLNKFIMTELHEKESHFVGSSSVDHFFMDGADELYDTTYLVYNEQEKKHLLYYGRVRDPQEGIKFHVPKGTQPTWEELKEMCK